MLYKFFIALSLVFSLQHAAAQDIPLYEGAIPNSRPAPEGYAEKDSLGRIFRVTKPVLMPFFPREGKANGTAVLIFPGGGYFLLSMPACEEIARALADSGITAFIVKYRLPSDVIMKDKSTGPLQDALSAIRLVRRRAAEWGIDPHRVGLMGLSAGGHLASMVATQQERTAIPNPENTDLRPDFLALLYPVIIYDPEVPRTRENLIGKNPSAETLRQYSTDQSVSSKTPPAFLVHAADDSVIPLKNTLAFFNALIQHNVKTELHVLQTGDHGFALTDLPSGGQWFQMFQSWLRENGWLTTTGNSRPLP
ncbi:alpha/beta hydrolase [Chitinophaga caseinilytica]|uniref:alpha/beta hydrolase n=1 Tax=Chitinophaga caseinilytica TaxID=2267521 RepID=UPI003C2C3851